MWGEACLEALLRLNDTMPNTLMAQNQQHLDSSLGRLSGYPGCQGVGRSRMLQASQECKLPHSIKDSFARGQRRQGCCLRSAVEGTALHTSRLLETPQISDHPSLATRYEKPREFQASL